MPSFAPNTARQVSHFAPPAPLAANHSYIANTSSLAPDITVSELAALLKITVSVDQPTYNTLPSNVQRHFKVA